MEIYGIRAILKVLRPVSSLLAAAVDGESWLITRLRQRIERYLQ
jgi:hypothetical protein